MHVDGQGDGGLENWTFFMDVICASSLVCIFQINGAKITTFSDKILVKNPKIWSFAFLTVSTITPLWRNLEISALIIWVSALENFRDGTNCHTGVSSNFTVTPYLKQTCFG